MSAKQYQSKAIPKQYLSSTSQKLSSIQAYPSGQYANQEPEFDLSQLGTIVVGDNDNSTNSNRGYNRGYYFLLLSVDGDRLAYLVAASKYDNSVINWKTPSKMVEFLGEFDLLNQHWVDFKSKAIGYIMGKFELDASK